jgi:hypothetical protein
MSMNMNVEEVSKTTESSSTEQVAQQTDAQPQQQQQQVKLADLKVNTENDALNYMVGFLELAQRRGVYTLEEAAKINECVAKFRRPAQTDAQA